MRVDYFTIPVQAGEAAIRSAQPSLELIGDLLAAGRAGLKPAPTKIYCFHSVAVRHVCPGRSMTRNYRRGGFQTRPSLGACDGDVWIPCVGNIKAHLAEPIVLYGFHLIRGEIRRPATAGPRAHASEAKGAEAPARRLRVTSISQYFVKCVLRVLGKGKAWDTGGTR